MSMIDVKKLPLFLILISHEGQVDEPVKEELVQGRGNLVEVCPATVPILRPLISLVAPHKRTAIVQVLTLHHQKSWYGKFEQWDKLDFGHFRWGSMQRL